jgi:hypothetical protein
MSQDQIGDDGTPPIINASEIGRYAYCARAWWLHRALGYAPHNTAALERGTRRHEEHGRTVIAAQQQMIVVRWLLLAALVTAIVLILLFLRT